ncbi:hypothetical protein J4H70_25565, partial [Vibrio alginolyticus]
MKHWNDHSIAKSGSSAECHTFSVNMGSVNTYLMPKCSPTYSSKHVVKSLRYQAMALMTQGIAMMPYGS